MNGRVKLAALVAVALVAVVVTTVAVAGGGKNVRGKLSGYNEDPMTISSTGRGDFHARIQASREQITYRLSYASLEGSVQQAHIHFGGPRQSGGISVFLCTNVGGGPAGTQACPAAPATITGTITPEDVIGPTSQGIEPGSFDELVDAIRAGVAYVNVHSSKWPAGEIRSQLFFRRR
jgi:hypothetical protein